MHPIIALSVLEAVRASDLAKGAPPDAADAGQEAIKLGRTTSVAAQIERYSSLVRRSEVLASEELTALFTLVSRRPDASNTDRAISFSAILLHRQLPKLSAPS